MSRRWITSAVLVALACKPGDNTGPGGGPPPPPVTVNLQNPAFFIDGVAAFEAAWGSPAVHSATGLGAVVGVAGAAPARAPMCGATAPGVPASPFDVFPDTALGHIYLYDSASGHFRAGPSGGPTGGVEFLLPVVDTLGHVVFPAQRAGTLDLFDVTPVGGILTLHGVISGVAGESADYTFAAQGRPDSNAGILSGRVAASGRVFSFRDSTTGYLSQTTARAVVSDSGNGGTMKLIATRTQSDAFDNFYDVDFTYQSPAQRVRMLGHITTYCLIPTIGLSVTVNDSDFAIVTQGTKGPVITSLTDSALTPSQDSAIRALMRGQGELFSWLAGLAAPTKQFLP